MRPAPGLPARRARLLTWVMAASCRPSPHGAGFPQKKAFHRAHPTVTPSSPSLVLRCANSSATDLASLHIRVFPTTLLFLRGSWMLKRSSIQPPLVRLRCAGDVSCMDARTPWALPCRLGIFSWPVAGVAVLWCICLLNVCPSFSFLTFA